MWGLWLLVTGLVFSFMQGIFHARLFLVELGFSGRTNANYRHTTDEFCQSFLQFFTIII